MNSNNVNATANVNNIDINNGKSLVIGTSQEIDLTNSVFLKAGISFNATAETAIAELNAIGVKVNDSMDSNTVVLIASVNSDLQKSGNALKEACIKLGYMHICNTWQTVDAPNGKPYKNEKAFLQDMLPQYAHGTIRTYMNTALNVYIPLLEGNKEYTGLEFLANMSPSMLKTAIPCMESAETRQALLDECNAIKAESGNANFGSRQLAQASAKARKLMKDSYSKEHKDRNPELPVGDVDAVTQVELQDNYKAMLHRYIAMSYDNTDEYISASIDKDSFKDLFALLDDCESDSTKAIAFVKAFHALVKANSK